ncbi:hypothetical protein CsmBV28.15 [Diolcogaster facetosa bracovirus]|uniref:Uncharacterized protein n=1 Tax=Bracoviriform facetosae TaxID=2083300 RepID=R9XL20_9VIRU|nr:hypothetical protein CsmBV28.15 [Diolcogaster facetosa bracovirus] [Bracoviriform facetosae]YP_009665882.1 hypothetical protein CsmBV28.15 [Diolcogaster facetosa bracovirus] [Bracoviriform facetosae]AGO14397.1 hypothetical protein CsmBV28.15 [Diolcogaster facetosa bracovirus] [Bracoviriform facetosae]AGO14470.1 hypothetical protein CsmBV28.15 [Diolcogaster facetosa bracovirus] [Bracoviriform facetosae]
MDRVAEKFSEIKNIVQKKINGVSVKKESTSKSTKPTDGKQKIEDSGFKDPVQASTSFTSTLELFLRKKVFKSKNSGNEAESSSTETLEKVPIRSQINILDRSDHSSTSGRTDTTSISEVSD